jgi:hypothetical protein
MADTNKFNVNTSWGDNGSLSRDEQNPGDHAADFARDSAGIPSADAHGQFVSKPLSFEPNKFPRETGHDSLTEEEAQLC